MKFGYIIFFNNSIRSLKYVECPHETHNIFRRNLHITTGHGGGVGLAVVRDFTIHVWSSSERSLTCTHTLKPHINVYLATPLSLDTSFPYCVKIWSKDTLHNSGQ
jgi:hypothetical protein